MPAKNQHDETRAPSDVSRMGGIWRGARLALACSLGLGIASACGGASSSGEGKPQTETGGAGADVAGGASVAGGAGTAGADLQPSGVGGIASGGQMNSSQGGALLDPVGGAAGEGGGPATPDEPTLGGSCAPPGALACAGYHQKLTLVCSAAGAWDVNQTCPSGQFCESTEGPDLGVCKAPDAGCVTHPLGDAFCAGTGGNDAVQCDRDGLAAELVEHCAGRCVDGKCAAALPCPDNIVYSCDPKCPGKAPQTVPTCFDLCPTVPGGLSPLLHVPKGVKSAIALPSVPKDTLACSCERAKGALESLAFRLPIYVSVEGRWSWRVTYPEGWNLHWVEESSATPPKTEYNCTSDWPSKVSTTPGCAIIPGSFGTRFWLSTDLPVPDPATAFIELLSSTEAQCP